MDKWLCAMDPMDDALIDRLVEKSKYNSRKGRKAKWRLERLLKRRIKLAEDAVLYGDSRIESKKLNAKWLAGFDKGIGKDRTVLHTYSLEDARVTRAFYEHYVTARGKVCRA